MRRLLPIAACLVLSCPKGEVPEPAAADEPAAQAPERLPAAHTKLRVDLADQMMHSVVRGDLKATKDAAAGLSALAPASGLPAEWKPYVADLQAAAGGVVEADGLPAAASAVARVAGRCQACHLAGWGGPDVSTAGLMPEPAGAPAHMPQHMWAVNWMWLSLISIDSHESWSRGAEALAAQHPSTPEEAPMVPEWAHPIDGRLHEIAGAAAGADGPEERAAAWARVVGICANCHAATRDP